MFSWLIGCKRLDSSIRAEGIANVEKMAFQDFRLNEGIWPQHVQEFVQARAPFRYQETTERSPFPTETRGTVGSYFAHLVDAS